MSGRRGRGDAAKKEDDRLKHEKENGIPIAAESPRLRVPASPRRFSVHVAWTLATRVLMTINSVAAGIIVARWLGAEGLGQLAVINVAVAIVVQLGSAGLPSANTYFIAQDRSRYAAAAVNSLIFALVVGSLLALGLTGLAMWQPDWFGFIPSGLIGIAAASIPFQLVTLVGLNIFLAVGRVWHFNLIDLAGQSFVLVNAIVALVLLNTGLWTIVSLNSGASALLGAVIVSLIAAYGLRMKERLKWRPDFELFGRMVRYGVKFHIATLAGLLIFRVDLLVVSHFRGSAEAGVYGVATQFSMMLMMLPSVIGALLMPRVASESDAAGEFTVRVTRHTAFVMLLVCLAAVPVSAALPYLYGAQFKDATVQLLILLPGVFLVGIESVVVQHFSGTGLPAAIPIFWLITLATNIALNLAFVPASGARAAATVSSVSYAMIFLLVIWYFRRRTRNSLSTTLLIRGDELRDLFALLRRGASSA